MKIKLLCTVKTDKFTIAKGSILEESIQMSTGEHGFSDPSQLYRLYKDGLLFTPFITMHKLEKQHYEVMKEQP